MRARFCEVRNEAVFEIVSGMDSGDVVRLPFVDSDEAESLGPAVAEMLNNSRAKERCRDLHSAIAHYLDQDDGGESGVESVKKAAAVINAIEMLRVETRQSVA